MKTTIDVLKGFRAKLPSKLTVIRLLMALIAVLSLMLWHYVSECYAYVYGS